MAEQMKLSFLATTASKIDELPIVNGQFILIKDINTIAVDMNDKRTKYEQIITLASDSDRFSILAPVNGVFYFVVETNSLWKYDQGWKMICSAQSAIPTGGSNGQILKKKSDSDYDVEWQDDTGGSVGVEYDAEKQAIVFENGGGEGTIDPEQIKQAVNGYLEENPVSGMTTEQEQQLNQNTQDVADLKSAMPKVDSTLSNTGEAADAKATGEALNSKAKNAGWNPEKIIGTDTEGNLIDMDVSQLDIKNLIFKSEDGKKYSVSVDNDGNVGVERQYEMPTDGLILDVQVDSNGEHVVDNISGKIIEKLTVDGDYFRNAAKFDLISTMELGDIGSDFTIVAVPFVKSSEEISNTNGNNYRVLFETSGGYNPIQLNNTTVGKYFSIYDNAGFGNYSSERLYYYAFLDPEKNKLFDNSDLLYAFSKSYNENTLIVQLNENLTKGTPTEKSLTYLSVGTGFKYKRVLLYKRALNEEELDILYKVIQGNINKKYPSQSLLNGIVGLGSPSAFDKLPQEKYSQYFDTDVSSGSHTYESVTGRSYEFQNVEFQNPSVNSDTSKYEEVIFINPINSIKMGDMYAIEAMPYPYNVKEDSYNVEYISDHPEILECYQGILIPKAVGSATITAKISNSEITNQILIEVKEKDPEKTNFCYIPENYVYGVHALNSGNPVSVANAIRGAIMEAAEAGYDGVIFPQRNYYVKFSDVDEDGAFLYIPSNFIIDFNNSKLFVVPRDNVKEKGITLFVFGNKVEKNDPVTGYPDRVMCYDSVIKNLYFFGERYTTEYEDENEFKGSTFAKFYPSSRNCKLFNVHTEGTTGWVIDASCSDYNYWTGTDRRGRTYYTDYVSGKLDETGTEVVEDPTGTWYCTPEYLTLGYVYGKDSIKTNEMDKYVFGFMGIVTYGNPGRWYDIFFFDNEKNLISYNPKQFGLEPYQLPENAVYFKVNVPFGEAPTKNSGEDQCVIRLYPYMEPTGICIDKCSFVNPQYTCLSMTGGVGFVVRDTYVENGVITEWMWAIDWEDGWQAMRHNIHYRVLCNGNFQQPGGHHCCIMTSVISNLLNIANDTEATVTLNSVIGTVSLKAKANEFTENIHYRKFNKSYSFPDISTIREVNNSKLDTWDF